MKTMKKIFALLIVAAMMLAAIPAVSATEYKENAGKTVKVDFVFNDACVGFDGTITFSNIDLFSKITYTASEGFTGDADESLVGAEHKFIYEATEVVELKGVLTLTLTIKDDAKVGDSCAIVCNSEYSNTSFELIPVEEQVHLITVTEKAPVVIPQTPSKTVDYTELKKVVGEAGDMVKGDYTLESWIDVVKALAHAKAMLNAGKQEDVDAAVKALKDAIAALVLMDYSALKDVVTAGEALIDGDELGTQWNKLAEALANAQNLLTSGDQEAVDAAVAEIQAIIDALKAALEEKTEPEVVIQEVIKEVEVEVEPTEPFCNIDLHKVWPVLFFISLALNIVLVIVLVTKKNRKAA